MTTALRTRTLLFSSESSRRGGRSKSPSPGKRIQKQFRLLGVLLHHAKGRGRINAFSVGVKAAKEEDDDANNGLRRRRRNRTTNKTDYDEETGGKQR